MKTELKVALGFAAALGVLSYSVLKSWQSDKELQARLAERELQRDFASRIDAIDRDLMGAMLVEQRFMLLGKRRDFEEYLQLMDRIYRDVTESEAASLSSLPNLIRRQLNASKLVLTKRDSHGLAPAIQLFLEGSVQRPLRDLTDAMANLRKDAADQATLEMQEVGVRESESLRSRTLELLVVFSLAIATILLAFWDLRLLKRQREELQEAERRASEASEVKSAFLANMSHEIRTPMNAVIGISQFLQETPLSEEQEGHVQTILGASKGLLNLLNDILDISKIESGRMVLESIPFDLRRLVHETFGILKVQVRAKGLSLIQKISEDIPPQVLGDPTRLRQILLNLLGNAIKFTDAGEVRVAIVPTDTGAISFSIADTGRGMTAEGLKKLFQRFQQAESDTFRKFGGTGLGLTISQELVQRMGGALQVQSTPGKGTTFSFSISLPKVEGAELVAKRSSDSASLLHGKYILLAEDEVIGQKITARLLQKLGCRAKIAATGLDVMEAIRAESFDAVLMDCHMPEQDGYETTRRIRAGEVGQAELPIIALTAGAMKEEAERCFAVGMDAFVTKPIDFESLRAALEQQIFRKREKPHEGVSKRAASQPQNSTPPPVPARRARG